jgi:hypothetical protein
LEQALRFGRNAISRAQSLEPDNAHALLFRALLQIEQMQFAAALINLQKAYSKFTKLKMPSRLDYVSNMINYYQDSVGTAKRVSKFGSLPTKEQIKVLGECGVQLTQTFDFSLFMKKHAKSKTAFEKEDPFQNLLIALAFDDVIENGTKLYGECIFGAGDYKVLAETFSRIAGGAFPIEDCDDEIAWSDDVLRTPGKALLKFRLGQQEFELRASTKDYGWIDINILKRLARIAEKHSPDLRFLFVADELILCLKQKQVATLQERTLIDFELLSGKNA